MVRQIAAARTASGLRVTSPYGHQLTDQLKAAGARWDANGKAWVVPTETADPVLDTLRAVYGSVDGTDWVTVDLRPTADMDDKHLFWGPWWLAAGASMGSPIVAGVAVVSGRLGTGGSRKYPTVRAKTDVTIRLQVPRDWFARRDASADRGWVVTEVVVAPSPVVDTSPVPLASSAPSPVPTPVASVESLSDGDLIREMRRRAARAMDEARRIRGPEASADLDKLGTLLAALEALS
jgi:hypothetical protein